VRKDKPSRGAKRETATPVVVRRVRERPPGPVLIDTSVLIWWMTDVPKLSRLARTVLESNASALVSAVSLWEIGMKVRNRKLDLGVEFVDFVRAVESTAELTVLPVDLPTWLGVVELDWDHGDPADRIIVATALRHRATLVSSDRAIRAFYAEAVW
jgi:PIN domain nuclease of toxin-antitoxin system